MNVLGHLLQHLTGTAPPPPPEEVLAHQPSPMESILNQLGVGFLGTDGIRQQRAQAQRQIDARDIGSLIGKLGPQYQDGPQARVGTPTVGDVPSPDAGNVASGWQYQSPQMTSPGASLQEVTPQLAALAARKVPGVAAIIEMMKANQPNIQNNGQFTYDAHDPKAAGQFFPKIAEGQEPLYDRNHNIVGVRNMDGSIQSAADMTASTEGAKAKANAPFQFQTVVGPDGRPRVISNATAAALGSGGGIIAAGPSSAQTAADTARASAGAQAEIGLPQATSTAEQALGLINTLKSHPALKDRTGLLGLVPAIPGTPGADFDAMAAQLKGKVFLQAYGDLKGAGQITEIEGKKATEAIARLNQTQTHVGYVKALDDLASVIQNGLARAQAQPGRLQPRANASMHPPAPPALTSTPLADRMAEARRRGLIQ